MIRRINDSYSREEIQFIDDLFDVIKENYDFYADEEITEELVNELGMKLHKDTNGNGEECVCWNVKQMGTFNDEAIAEYAVENELNEEMLYQELYNYVQNDNASYLAQIGEECKDKFGFEMYQFGRNGGWFGFEEINLLEVLEADKEKLAKLVLEDKDIRDMFDLDDYSHYDLVDIANLLEEAYLDELKNILHLDKDFVKFCDDAWKSIKEESDLKGSKEDTIDVLKSLGF